MILTFFNVDAEASPVNVIVPLRIIQLSPITWVFCVNVKFLFLNSPFNIIVSFLSTFFVFIDN